MDASSAAVSFISTYHRESPLRRLSDEAEVAEFTECSYGKMDVSGSGGHSHISLRRSHKPAHRQVRRCVS